MILMCYIKLSFRAVLMATKGVLASRVFSSEAFHTHLGRLVNTSAVTNCVVFLQDKVCCR